MNPAPVYMEAIGLPEANALLVKWNHKMGPVLRGNGYWRAHALFFNDEPVALTTAHTLIAARVGGTDLPLDRSNTVELSRLCASRPAICRCMIRLWREFVFPHLGFRFCISYQDALLHSGNTYRFDGWKQIGESRSGTDTRSGRKGRHKVVWLWEHR